MLVRKKKKTVNHFSMALRNSYFAERSLSDHGEKVKVSGFGTENKQITEFRWLQVVWLKDPY